eukprot:CAMPEP_0197527640 /NCGR_PEP_ID=MMETSP1318-20131121/22465_1 /TAXON_ID=552666 /ORGANISM="Partenskyella glossopodia, Strain RCC365" /LENGTH=102 /DNA_ID=CAMNT_0043082399 /DNA_START=758 /DNA_END=1067 /DNA_ORIENTATION=+
MPQQLFGPPPAIPTAAPDPACVETLVSMGFDEERARSALARTHNNIEAAVGLLVQLGESPAWVASMVSGQSACDPRGSTCGTKCKRALGRGTKLYTYMQRTS